VYNSVQQLLEDEQFSYEYDAEGNLITRIDKSSGVTRQFSYDSLNRLATIKESEAGNARFKTVPTYGYDALSRRVTRAAEGKVTRFLWQGDRMAMEKSGSTVDRRYRYTGSIAASEYADASGEYHVHRNRSGEAIALTKPTGEVAWRRNLIKPFLVNTAMTIRVLITTIFAIMIQQQEDT